MLLRLSRRYLRYSFIVLLIYICAACSVNPVEQTETPSTPSTQTKTALPGQQIWKDGVSSFLFGTNDTYEWSQNNIQTQPAIQQALKDAGFSLIRTFFPDNATDAVIEQRVRTIENSGAQCLGVITNIANTTFNEHLVRYLGKRCLMYEFGNESDYVDNGIPIEKYLSLWNDQIPRLRKINPAAKFIGPVTFTYYDDGNNEYMRRFLAGVESSQVLPDAVSFHLYACYQDSRENCLSKASRYKQATEGIRTLVKQTLGKELPVGITEWNFDPGNPPPDYGEDENFMTQFTVNALNAMIQGGLTFACQFDAASYSGYGRLDMFNVENNQPKAQFKAIKSVIDRYRPSPGTNATSTAASDSPSKYVSLVSRNKPVGCAKNKDGAGGPEAIVDGHYGNWGFWGSSINDLPDSCAIKIGKGPSRILLVWESAYIFDYISDEGMTPQDYTISTSADSTNGVDGTWKTAATVTGNHTRIREHMIDFSGQVWVKMTVTKAQPHPSQPYIHIDEIDVFDVSSTLDQTFFFSGDSISVEAYNRFDDNQPSFPELVHKAYPQYYPAVLNGGMGGWSSGDAVTKIDLWLSLNPDIHYWLLGWGTNDAMQSVDPQEFQGNMQKLIDKIKQAGHVPILAHIPYMKNRQDADQYVQKYNTIIDQLAAANGLSAGPDLYKLTHDHPDYIDTDGIHPTSAGGIAMSRAWFEALKKPVFHG